MARAAIDSARPALRAAGGLSEASPFPFASGPPATWPLEGRFSPVSYPTGAESRFEPSSFPSCSAWHFRFRSKFSVVRGRRVRLRAGGADLPPAPCRPSRSENVYPRGRGGTIATRRGRCAAQREKGAARGRRDPGERSRNRLAAERMKARYCVDLRRAPTRW